MTNNILSILDWYLHSGDDIAMSDCPVNRLVLDPKDKSILSTPITHALPTSRAATSSDSRGLSFFAPHSDILKNTLQMSQSFNHNHENSHNTSSITQHHLKSQQSTSDIDSLEGLRKAINALNCPLKNTARNLVFADGNPKASIMLVGEAPGRDEDEQGLPFVGRAGQLLDKMLASINLTRQDCYITNILAWRPPANRTPSLQEIATFYPFVMRHIALINPKILVMLGGVATAAITGSKEGIMKIRGKWMMLPIGQDGQNIKAISTLHPAYLLRQPLQKKLAWQDLCAIKDAYNLLSTQ